MRQKKEDRIGKAIIALEDRIKDILVVEDNDILRGFIVGALQREGYNVVSTAYAGDAHRYIHSSIDRKSDTPYFDVIISDDKIIDGTGSEILLEFRKEHRELDNTYMLLMSGTFHGEREDRGLEELRKHGIDYLCKVDGNIIDQIKAKLKTNAPEYFAECLMRKSFMQGPTHYPKNAHTHYEQPAEDKIPPGPITLD